MKRAADGPPQTGHGLLSPKGGHPGESRVSKAVPKERAAAVAMTEVLLTAQPAEDRILLTEGRWWSPNGQCVVDDDGQPSMTPKNSELETLAYLVQAKGRVVMLDELSRALGLTTGTLGSLISRIRKALPNGPQLLQTLGGGYRFDLEPRYLDGQKQTLGSMTIYPEQRVVACGKQHVALRPQEFALLLRLFQDGEGTFVSDLDQMEAIKEVAGKTGLLAIQRRLARDLCFAIRLDRSRQGWCAAICRPPQPVT